MKKMLKISVVFLLLLTVAAIAAPFFVSGETYRQKIMEIVRERTGRELTIDGRVQLSLFPTFGVTIENAALSNPEGYTDKYMLKAPRATIGIELLPLLGGDVRVKRFVLENPALELEINAKGKPNWVFAPLSPESRPRDKQAWNLVSHAEAADSSPYMRDLRLGEVRIDAGAVRYRDQRNKSTYRFEHIDASLSMPSLNEPFTLVSSLLWNEKKVKIHGNFETPARMMRRETVAITAWLTSELLNASFNGKLQEDHTEGKVEIQSRSLSELSAWLGQPFANSGAAPLRLQSAGYLRCEAQECSLKNANVALDAAAFTGELGMAWSGRIPAFSADLATAMLDITPYMKRTAAMPGAWLIAPALAQPPSGWSDAPIDLSALRQFDLRARVKSGGFKTQRFSMGNHILTARLERGRLNLEIAQAELYGGSGEAGFIIGADGVFEHRLALTGAQARPMLSEVLNFNNLSGTSAIRLHVTGKGTTEREIVSSLSGSGDVKLTNGAINGINLAEMTRNIQSAYKPVAQGTQKTDFAEFGGTFTIRDGILINNDLALKAPLLRLTGQGAVDMPARTVQYRLKPMIVGTLQGQDGKDKAGIEVPVIVEGGFEHLTFRPDVESIAREALENPQELKENIKHIRKNLKEELSNSKDAVRELKGLLKGF